MEKDGTPEQESSRNRKRTRDEEDDKIESPQGKKQECGNDLCSYEFQDDGIGVFDFPWLKQGVIFDDHQDQGFSPPLFLDKAPGISAAAPDPLFPEISCVSPGLDGEFRDKKSDDGSFCSLLADDLEPVDCIWSSIINQPLDLGFSKGRYISENSSRFFF